jgi:hypothetical protein
VNTDFGRLNLRLGRVQQHISKIQFFMLLYLMMDNLSFRYGISSWWALLLIPGVMVVHFIDKKWIYTKEMAAATLTNPEWNRLVQSVEKVGRRVDKMREQLEQLGRG